MKAGARNRSRWSRPALFGSLLLCVSCGKFREARECGAFVKTVNTWLARPDLASPAPDAAPSGPKQVAAESRRTAQSYRDLSLRLAALHIQNDELKPRVQQYQQIADAAATALSEVAAALDRGNLDDARKRRVEFDIEARREGPLVQEINGLCR